MRAESAALALVLSACTAPHHAVVLTAPQCDEPGVSDISATVGEHEGMFRRALKDDVVVVHSQESVERAIDGAMTPTMLIYSGHGVMRSKSSHLCLKADRVSVEGLVRRFRETSATATRGPLTLLLNTCVSANSDLRDVPRDVSIISASSDEVSPDAKFAQATVKALDSDDLDRNCDGLVTDQELFDKLLRELGEYEALGSAVPFVDLRAKPRLQRHAMGQLPLPIRSRCWPRQGAPKLKDGSAGAELQIELDKQERLARGSSFELPSLGWDYYVVDAEPGAADAAVGSLHDALALIRRCGRKADHSCAVPFPGTDEEAERVARYATFTDVFRIELRWSYARVVRLRDGVLIATRHLGTSPRFDDMIAALPLRLRELKIDKAKQRIALDSAVADRVPKDWRAIPCSTELLGECFEGPP